MIITAKTTNRKYAVLIKYFNSVVCFFALNSINLFLKPFPTPISKIKNQDNTDDNATHKPYPTLLRYDKDIGTIIKLIIILTIFKEADKLTFFKIKAFLELLLGNKILILLTKDCVNFDN